MVIGKLILGLALTAAAGAKATVPYPATNFPYFAKVRISNPEAQNASTVETLRDESIQACRIIHRALFAVESYYPEIQEYVGSNGANFPVLYKNREFYRRHLVNRYEACTSGRIKLHLYGRCGTERETVAFVKVTLGFVHSTINICDEFFAQSADQRVGTLVHEYGRLENIGDSSKFDTNNIYVWDAIVGRLGDPKTFGDLADLKAKKKPTP